LNPPALLQQGADINAKDNYGKTVFVQACERDTKAALALLEAGATVNVEDTTTALHIAVSRGNATFLAKLITAGADVNWKNSRDMTSLHLAAEKGNPKILTALLKAGANINEKDAFGRTPLSIAANTYNESINPDLPQTVPLLLAAGASLDDEILKLTRGGMNEAAIERADKLGAMLIARTASTEGTVYEGRITNIDDLITRMNETDTEAPHRHEMVETFKALEQRKQREKPALVQIEAAKAAREADKAGREAHELSVILTKQPTSDAALAAQIVAEQARLPLDKARESLRRANEAAEQVGLPSIHLPGILSSKKPMVEVTTQPPALDSSAGQHTDQRQVLAAAAELRRQLVQHVAPAQNGGGGGATAYVQQKDGEASSNTKGGGSGVGGR